MAGNNNNRPGGKRPNSPRYSDRYGPGHVNPYMGAQPGQSAFIREMEERHEAARRQSEEENARRQQLRQEAAQTAERQDHSAQAEAERRGTVPPRRAEQPAPVQETADTSQPRIMRDPNMRERLRQIQERAIGEGKSLGRGDEVDFGDLDFVQQPADVRLRLSEDNQPMIALESEDSEGNKTVRWVPVVLSEKEMETFFPALEPAQKSKGIEVQEDNRTPAEEIEEEQQTADASADELVLIPITEDNGEESLPAEAERTVEKEEKTAQPVPGEGLAALLAALPAIELEPEPEADEAQNSPVVPVIEIVTVDDADEDEADGGADEDQPQDDESEDTQEGEETAEPDDSEEPAEEESAEEPEEEESAEEETVEETSEEDDQTEDEAAADESDADEEAAGSGEEEPEPEYISGDDAGEPEEIADGDGDAPAEEPAEQPESQEETAEASEQEQQEETPPEIRPESENRPKKRKRRPRPDGERRPERPAEDEAQPEPAAEPEIEPEENVPRRTAVAAAPLYSDSDYGMYGEDSGDPEDRLFTRVRRSAAPAFSMHNGATLPKYIDDDDFVERWLGDEEDEDLASQKKNRRRRAAAFIGAATMILALIGFIAVAKWGIGLLSNLGGSESQKDIYGEYISPVVMSEVPVFETWDAIPQDKLLQSAVFTVLMDNDITYERDDTGKFIVPSTDIVNAVKEMYGAESSDSAQDEEINTQIRNALYGSAGEDVTNEDAYYVDMEDSFHVADNLSGPAPNVTDISKRDNTITLRVEYMEDLETSTGGILYARQFVLNLNEDGSYYVKAIREQQD